MRMHVLFAIISCYVGLSSCHAVHICWYINSCCIPFVKSQGDGFTMIEYELFLHSP